MFFKMLFFLCLFSSSNCERDTVSCTSVYAAIVIYSIIDFRATKQFDNFLEENIVKLLNAFDPANGTITDSNYEDMLQNLNSTVSGSEGVEGTGLAFIVFAEAISNIPVSALWSILFFIMLFCLGLSTMFGIMEGIVSPLQELKLFPEHFTKEMITGSIPLFIIAFCEITGVAYLYGIDRFNKDAEFMIGHKPNLFWQVIWRVVSPLMVLVNFLCYFVAKVKAKPTYSTWNLHSPNFPVMDTLPYPGWVCFIIFLLAGIPSLYTGGFALYKLLQIYYYKENTTLAAVEVQIITL
ncbi:uncharacterized protein V6R79_000710 [Siganus canaliculatus]